jgi:acetoin utilization deacetylase AcuC-like enzyme
MMLSLKDLQRRDEILLKAFIRNRIPVAVLYGGGYNRQAEFTAKIHRNTVAMAKKIATEFRGL